MGFYAAPSYNGSTVVVVNTVYQPPIMLGHVTTLSKDGIYKYAPPPYNDVSLVLVNNGYVPPIPLSYPVTMDKELGLTATAQNVFALGSDSLSFGAISTSQDKFIDTGSVKANASAVLQWSGNYITTNQSIVVLRSHGDQLRTGQHSIRDKTTYVSVRSEKPSSKVSSSLFTRNEREFLKPSGIAPPNFNQPTIANFFKSISPISYDASAYGRPLVYNLKQFLGAYGYDQSLYGYPYLIGGVKYLSPRGYDSSAFGRINLLNTTADQHVKPQGINSLVVPAPTVSPRILYPSGIYQPKVGSPDIRDPAIKPLGATHTAYGTPTIWYHTRPLSPTGILSYQSGYPRVADPTQFTYPLSLDTSAVFGDVAIRNTSFRISPQSIYDSSFSDYATATNSNRYLAPSGINSLSMGVAVISNETPSVFVQGIANYDVGTPAVGYAIRYVQPTGFDHLLLGRPTVIKAPELLVRGFEDSRFANATVWYKNRVVDINQKGINSFKAGETTVWYGQRKVNPQSWQSSSYGKPVLTHEVREVIGQGFVRDSYGTAWVSRGTRIIEPTAIYKEFASNHYVGGVQTIAPQGYIATLWGERIIPDNQNLYPLGFSGFWGNTTVDLLTKYIEPVGFISIGQQPQDRWGDTVAYNLRQYIVQEFDINSGLVPPKWSDWTAIANRNITMRVTGFISQKFGYSQIDNNATPLLPTGIAPPPITIKMISHGARTVLPEAVEPPPLSSWGVVHNAGRVISPSGIDSANYGNDSTIINTRREYRNIGRIDSLETGTPMIAYRIRTIDIEPRYSIAPPQIDLPTIDLYTRYVSFRGYETAKYGLPSLSIHFNIIGPSWRHRDDFGYPALRNATPELLVGAFDSSEYGKPFIRTQWRHVQAQGDTATLFGSTEIADTKREIIIRGWQDSSVSQNHTVTKTATPPYGTQVIWLQNESNPSKDGYGIEPSSEPSTPALNQNVLYHQGHNSQKFGEAVVYSNNLLIEIGISTKNIEVGPVVMNKRRIVDVKGIDNEIAVSEDLRVSPSYIEPLSFNEPKSDNNYKFGRSVLTNQHRTIYPRGHSSSNVSRGAYVELQTRYIKPSTIRSFAMGFPEIPFTLKTINIKDNGLLSEQHGSTTIKHAAYLGAQTIAARGFSKPNFGAQRIELFNRQLLAAGRDSLQMGASKSGDTPYMWQGLRVGEFVPMSIGAGDTLVFGETTISLRIREIALEGFVAFRSEYDIDAFNERMKVTRASTDDELQQDIVTVGAYAGVIGLANVRLGQHFIRPDGNSDQFRKSGYSAEFGAPTISN